MKSEIRKFKQRSEGGFTLIELLTVLGIVAILAAISIPAVKRVTEAGNKAKCMSNLRQLGAAAHGYIGEHDGWMPPMRYPYNYTWWPDAISPYITSLPWEATFETTSPVFRCPSGSKDWPYKGTGIEIKGVNYAYNVKIGYMINGDPSGSTTMPIPLSSSYRQRKLVNCKYPTKTGLIMDGDSQRVQFEYYTKADVDARSLRHDGLANVLFVDGHVELVDFKKISDEDLDKLSLGKKYNDEWP